MKFIAIITVIAIIFFSCNDGSQNEKTVVVKDTTKIQDTIIVKDSIMNSTVADSLAFGCLPGNISMQRL